MGTLTLTFKMRVHKISSISIFVVCLALVLSFQTGCKAGLAILEDIPELSHVDVVDYENEVELGSGSESKHYSPTEIQYYLKLAEKIKDSFPKDLKARFENIDSNLQKLVNELVEFLDN